MSMEFHNRNGISGQMKILERKIRLQVPTSNWYYVKKKYKLNVDFFAESTESDSAVFRNHVFQIIQSG